MPYSYLWSDSTTGTGLYHLNAGYYSFVLTDFNGCTKTQNIEVPADNCTDIIVHNVITPNGDGINDTWVIEGMELYPKNTVQVFDKWGDMIYEKTNYKNDWAGKDLPDGTYYYLVKLNGTNLRGGKETFTGTVLIKR